MGKAQRKFDAEYKREAIRSLEETGRPLREVAEELQVSEQSLWRWRKQYGTGATERLSPSEAAELRRLRREVEILRQERDFLKKGDGVLRESVPVRYACIRRHHGTFPIGVMCRVLAVSRAGYYAWCCRRPSARAQTDTRLRVAIRAIHAPSRERYGSPRVHRELRHQHWHCSRKRVARLMRLDGLRGTRRRRYRATTQADGTPPAPNRLGRRFRVGTLNRVWGSDVTAWWTAHGWLYVAVVLDLASRRVIGWAAGSTPRPGAHFSPAEAVQLSTDVDMLHHSDRGMHYTGTTYQRLLAAHGGIASMSRRGDCWDNAVVESFFATLKTELVAAAVWRSRAEGIDALRRYITWYNGRRLHSTLGYVSPARFERQLAAA